MLVIVVHSFFNHHFIFDLHLSMFFIHICFSASSLTLPWTIAGCLHPFYTFSAAHRRVIRDTFIFNYSVIFLPRALRFWVGIFYSQTFFTLHSFTDILTAFFKSSLGAGSSSLKFAGLHIDPRNTDAAHLFVWFKVIHNLHNQNDSVLNSAIYYHELLLVKVWFICSYSFRTLFACSKSCVKTIKKHFEQG